MVVELKNFNSLSPTPSEQSLLALPLYVGYKALSLEYRTTRALYEYWFYVRPRVAKKKLAASKKRFMKAGGATVKVRRSKNLIKNRKITQVPRVLRAEVRGTVQFIKDKIYANRQKGIKYFSRQIRNIAMHRTKKEKERRRSGLFTFSRREKRLKAKLELKREFIKSLKFPTAVIAQRAWEMAIKRSKRFQKSLITKLPKKVIPKYIPLKSRVRKFMVTYGKRNV